MTLDGKTQMMIAAQATGAERERLWASAQDCYAGFDRYRLRAGGRDIPVMILRPAGSPPG